MLKYFTVWWCRHEVCKLKKTFCRNVFIYDYPIYINIYIYIKFLMCIDARLQWYFYVGIKWTKTRDINIKLPEAYNFIKKETLAQVYSCEFCETFKNTFYRTPPEDCFWTIFFTSSSLKRKWNVLLFRT